MSIILRSAFTKITFNKCVYNRISVRYAESATFPIQEYKYHRLNTTLPVEVSVTRNEALIFIKQMMTVRRMENLAANLYSEKLIRGFCHLYSGQEAICVGVKSALEEGDGLITAYRAHGWCLMMGQNVKGIIGELMGLEIGCARGKGGSMHMYCKDFYGGNGIVGAQVPLGVGIGFANKYKDNGKISIAIYGDGAANQGQISEVFNMSKLWNLPVIFMCENNLFGMGTSSSRASANDKFYTRGDVIPGIQIDGMDILAVREAFKFARNYVLKEGPIVLEMVTYRYFGHSMSDPGTSYRTRVEVAGVRKERDPITSFKDKLVGASVVTDAEIKDIEKETQKEIANVLQVCKKSKEIALKELTADVCALNLHPNIRNILPWNSLSHSRIGKAVNL